nr:unnamed protein product [Digitaria exilis]
MCRPCPASPAASAEHHGRGHAEVAVITGAATARKFVRHGARVVLADVQDDPGHALAADLGADAACYTRCDVTDESQVAAAVDLAVAHHGKLDVVFNNAGIVVPLRGRRWDSWTSPTSTASWR